MTSPYGKVLSVPGAVAFSASGLLGRLPISMIGLGIVIVVSTRTGSYAVAGSVSACYVAASAVGSIPLARLVDRRGQARVLGAAATVSVGALALLVAVVELDWPTPWPHLVAALSGVAMPNLGAAVRERWSHALEDRSLLDTAFAIEAINDEVVFIVGPALTTVLATTVHPVAGLAAAGAASLVGTWGLVAQRRTEPPRHHHHHHRAGGRMPWPRLIPMGIGAVALGGLFGGCEVAVVAFTDQRGDPATSGLLLALWALGSLVAGVVTGSLRMRRDAAVRYRFGTLGLAVLMLPLPFVQDTLVLAGFLFLAGIAISPTLIAIVTWIEATVPRTQLNEGMAAFTTGLFVGVAPGAAIVGAVVDEQGASASFWVPAISAIIAAVTSLAIKSGAPADAARVG